MSRKNHSDEYGYYAPKKRKKNSPRDIITMVAGIVISVVLILLMVFNAPIINFKKVDGNTITTQHEVLEIVAAAGGKRGDADKGGFQ
mgnify:CR=1 FL=1